MEGNNHHPERRASFRPPQEVRASENNRDELAKTTARRELSEAEKKLKCFATILSYIDRFANQIKAMTIAWASFVLLGAFSDNLAMRDFWFATIVLLRAKFRLLVHNKYVIHVWGNSRSRQSSQATASRWSFWIRMMVMLVYIIELSVAIVFLVHTIRVPARVLVAKGEDKNTAIARNKKYSLVLFYCLVILESLLFVVEDLFYIIGITAVTCKSQALEKMSSEVRSEVQGRPENSEVVEEDRRLAAKLVKILNNCKDDDDPIIAKSVIEVASWMMSKSHEMVHNFVEMDLRGILEGFLDVADEEGSIEFEVRTMVDTALNILNTKKQDCHICMQRVN